MSVNSDLSSYIQAGDYKKFLFSYLTIVQEGQNLPVPTSLEQSGAEEGWSQIVPNYNSGYNNEFIASLSQYWLSIVKQQGGTITENFAEQCLAIMQGRPKPADVKPNSGSGGQANSSQGNPPQAQGSAPAAAANASETPTPAASSSSSSGVAFNEVASNISSGYYKEQTAREQKTLPKEIIEKELKQALDKRDAESFLLHYLSLTRHDIKIAAPLTTMLPNIKEKWNEILMRKYSLMAEGDFLKDLSKHWFALVNTKGLPMTMAQYQDLYFYMFANRKNEPPKTGVGQVKKKKEPSGIFGSIVNIFNKKSQ